MNNNHQVDASSLLGFREKLSNATSKEEFKRITRELLRASGNRYSGLREYVEEGNTDIKERLAFLARHAHGRVLDIGVYDGYFVHELEKTGFEVDGVDMMEEALPLFEKESKAFYPDSKARLFISFAEELPFQNDCYDTVIISHVLEHVFDPYKALQEGIRVCGNGGKIIVIVPPDIGNDPTHIRIVEEDWIIENSKSSCTIESSSIVGNGKAYILRKRASAI